jgi:DNA-binding transcriptional MerR regulator
MVKLRPSDLAREHGLSAQAVRNYERDGCLPPAPRTRSGYRVYNEVHASALRAFLALVRAYGHATAVEIMHAIHRDDLDGALMIVDRGHEQLLRDRGTLGSVRAAIGRLTATPESGTGRAAESQTAPHLSVGSQAARGLPGGSRAMPGPSATSAARPDRTTPTEPSSRPFVPFSIGELAHRLRVTPATLRNWEEAGILVPQRDQATGYRRFDAGDVRDAELAHLLRRGGYPLEHIATVLEQVREAGGAEALSEALENWQCRLTRQGRAMLDAAAHLSRYLETREP